MLVAKAFSHMIDAQYSNIKIVFLPASMTAKLQPLDQGVIRVVKMSYHKAITENVLVHIDVEIPDDLNNIINSLDFVVACKNIIVA